jgi:hypothetical protein
MSEATVTPAQHRTAPTAGPAAADEAETVDAVIFAGLYMLHRLRDQGLRVVVFEAGGDVGGTWYWNRYPGARVDVECVNYSFSFSSDLEQEYPWAERYAPQPEILKYARHVADRFDLRRDIRFSTRVAGARYDEPSKTWRIQTERGLRANIFERYGVEEVIIKGHTTLPDLRRIVTEVLHADSSVNATQEFKVRKSELSQRYRDWHGQLEGIIRTRIREAQNDTRGPGRAHGEAGDHTNRDENRLLLLREEFVRQTADFETVLSGAADVPEIIAAGDQMDRMMMRFATRIDGTTAPEN